MSGGSVRGVRIVHAAWVVSAAPRLRGLWGGSWEGRDLVRSGALAMLVALTVCCGSSRDAGPRKAPDGQELRPVTLPDMARSDEGVQMQARERYAAVLQKLEARAADAELGVAYGELGMLFHAAEYFDAAEPAYLNAQALMPREARWAYYLAHLYKRKGDTAQAFAAFRRALDLQPRDVATLVWLARLHIDQGQAAQAEPLLVQARSASPRAVAVLAGLGQTALMRRDYAAAAVQLEEALSIDPRATSVHAPLASAYRALGETAKAEAHLKQWRNADIAVPDPLTDRLAATLHSGVSFETRGVRAFEAGQWPEAASLFREGLRLTPEATPFARSLRQKLALALYLGGDADSAVKEFEEAVRLAPAGGLDEPAAQAHYGLGIISASAGRGGEAIEHLTRAIAYNPKYLQARVALGDALRRNGRFEESLVHYREAVQIDANVAEARLGIAMALVRLRRWVAARQWLEESVQAQPDRVDLAHALARILAAAPQPAARDGRRALAVAQKLLDAQKRTDFGETLAMALAETGNFSEAAGIQRGVLGAAERAGLTADARRIAANLRLYEQRQPCRTPWPDDDLVHSPGPPVSALSRRR